MEAKTITVALRRPVIGDAARLWNLIRRCPPLDVNSSYAYLLLAHHFADTCVVAEVSGSPMGFVSGYVPPRQPDTLFVWQVAVDSRARGQALGARMILNLIQRNSAYRFLHTTVSPSNSASRRMFERVAQELDADIKERTLFTSDHLGEVDHEDECLLVIGPFGREFGAENSRGETNGDAGIES